MLRVVPVLPINVTCSAALLVIDEKYAFYSGFMFEN